MSRWIDILRREVEEKGPVKVAKEIGYSRPAVDLVLKGTYKGNTRKVEAAVMQTYGNIGGLNCPVLGSITPGKCVDTWKLAKKIGMGAGNPETLKLYSNCLRCSVRRS